MPSVSESECRRWILTARSYRPRPARIVRERAFDTCSIGGSAIVLAGRSGGDRHVGLKICSEWIAVARGEFYGEGAALNGLLSPQLYADDEQL